MKHKIIALLKRLPFRVVRDIPKPRFEIIQLALAYQALTKPGATFVQIGACDGKTEDSVNRFVRSGVFRSILVEPIPSNFSQLTDEYRDAPNVTLVNAAIAKQSGTGSIFQVRNEGRWKDNPFSKQWASFDRNHILKLGATESEIDEVHIETVSLTDLAHRCGLRKIDMLQIDTEGFDAEVVRMALALDEKPDLIYFEYIHVKRELLSLMMELRSHGYTYAYDRYNVLAINERLTNRW